MLSMQYYQGNGMNVIYFWAVSTVPTVQMVIFRGNILPTVLPYDKIG